MITQKRLKGGFKVVMEQKMQEQIEGAIYEQERMEKVIGEPDFEFLHIVRVNGKLFCNCCGNWDFLMFWMDFIKNHQSCGDITKDHYHMWE